MLKLEVIASITSGDTIAATANRNMVLLVIVNPN